MSTEAGNDDDNDWASLVQRHALKVKKARELTRETLTETEEDDRRPWEAKNAQLLRERFSLEERIRAINAEFHENETRILAIKRSYHVKRTELERNWEAEDEEGRRQMQAELDAAAAESNAPAAGINGSTPDVPAAAPSREGTGSAPPISDAMEIDGPMQPRQHQGPIPVAVRAKPDERPAPPNADDGVNNKAAEPVRRSAVATVVSMESRFIGQVEPLSFTNEFIDALLKIRAKRDVVIRDSRTFTYENLQSIYDPSDAGGGKWIGCMIQATGEIQHTPCDACLRSQTVFAQCILYQGPDKAKFPRCGNCMWSRQGCGFTPPPPPPTMQTIEAPYEDEMSTGGFTAVNASASRKSSRDAPEVGREDPNGISKEKPPRRSLPDGKLTANPKDTPISKRFAKSPSGSEAGTPRADESDAYTGPAEAEGPPPPEITRSILALQHNGEFYTAPEIMVGVPVRKIDESDPYWDPLWVPIVPKMEEHLKVWEAKLEAHTRAAADPTEGKRSKHAQFLANRQVNRGRAVLEFLGVREGKEGPGDISPYQLVAKQFINSAYNNYDTLYRLVATIAELKKFSLDVNPLEWVRHRLHEIYSEYPLGFQLSKVVGELYHDPKLQALRSKNGFGNIGRPSGTGSRKSQGSRHSGGPGVVGADPLGSGRKVSRAEKRKEPHITPQITPKATPTKIMPTLMSMPAIPPISVMPSLPSMPEALARLPPGLPVLEPPRLVAPHPLPVHPVLDLSRPHPPNMQPNLSGAPSEAVQSYREALKRTQEVVNISQRRAEQTPPNPVPPPPPPLPIPAIANKKARLEAPPPAPPGPVSSDLPPTSLRMTPDDTMYDGYTSVDSYSGDMVMPLDWRVSVVKTWDRSSGTDITQYWHWVDAAQVDDGSEGDFFEHQVLSELKPPDWGVYKDPINFHLRLTELKAVVFAQGTPRIVVETKPVPGIEYRGDVLAEFKRERTKRRMLKFMRSKGVKVVKTDAAWINEIWERVKPEVLPGDDSDE